MRIEFVLKSEHVLASKGAWRPTPTQSTCLYYCDVMKLVSVLISMYIIDIHVNIKIIYCKNEYFRKSKI